MSSRIIRRARPEESDILTDITFRSKAHWVYSAELMELWRPLFDMPAERIARNPVYVLEADGRICGYYLLEHPSGEQITLENLFVDPACIGSDVGGALWEHALAQAASLGYRVLVFESDPHAEGFYLKMGAVQYGEYHAPIPGEPNRVMPKMRYELDKIGDGVMSILFHERPYRDDADLERMANLVCSFPDDHLNVVDLPYRLSSWVLDVPENVHLWEDADHQLAAWAMVKTPWLSLDYAMRPDAYALENDIVRWGVERCQAIADESGDEFPLFVRVRPDRTSLIAALEVNGFRRDDWSLIHMSRSLVDTIAQPEFPEGFTVRPLHGESEVADYVALHRAAFGSNAMTVEWRARTLDMRGYAPELDLFVIAPGGKPAAFCIGWMHGDEGQIEPIGVHPDYQGHGLGRALLLEALKRMREQGATQTHIESYTDNDPARGLYESIGYQIRYSMLSYVRQFKPSPEKSLV